MIAPESPVPGYPNPDLLRGAQLLQQKGLSIPGNPFGANAPVPTYIDGAALGDSITDQADDQTGYITGATAADPYTSNYGWLTRFRFFSKAKITVTMYSESGASSKDVLETQVPLALAGGHSWWFLNPIGINDSAEDPPLSGAESAAYIRQIVEIAVRNNKRIVLGSPTPNGSFSQSSANRFRVISDEMRKLSIEYAGLVFYVDSNALLSDPSTQYGGGYTSAFDTMTRDVDTVATHPDAAGADILGWAVHQLLEPYTRPYQHIRCNGDAADGFFPNGRLGGTAGTISSALASSGSVAPDGWTLGRGSANINYIALKARRLGLQFKSAANYPVGARLMPDQPNGLEYLKVSGAAGTLSPEYVNSFELSTTTSGAVAANAVVIPATSVAGVAAGQLAFCTLTDGRVYTTKVKSISGNNVTVLNNIPLGMSSGAVVVFRQVESVQPFRYVQPDAGGPVYFTVPAENRIPGTQVLPDEELFVELYSTASGAVDYVRLYMDVPAAAFVGKRVVPGIRVRGVGSPIPNAMLRVQMLDSAPAKITDQVGNGINVLYGGSKTPYIFTSRNVDGVIPIDPFEVVSNCVTMRFELRMFATAGIVSRCMLSNAFIDIL